MGQTSVEYYRERERIEREAARQAETEGARAAHHRLADGYAVLVRRCIEDGEGEAP